MVALLCTAKGVAHIVAFNCTMHCIQAATSLPLPELKSGFQAPAAQSLTSYFLSLTKAPLFPEPKNGTFHFPHFFHTTLSVAYSTVSKFLSEPNMPETRGGSEVGRCGLLWEQGGKCCKQHPFPPTHTLCSL